MSYRFLPSETMTSSDTVTIKVWDLPIRLFHWSLLALVITCWWTSTEDGDMQIHLLCGYAVLALLLFRLIWGVAGSVSARFSHFVTTPRAVLVYLATLFEKDAPRHLGHNPAGGWMVLALLCMLAAITLTGLFANDDMMTEGAWAHWVGKQLSDLSTEIHEQAFYALMALVVLHLAAIIFYLVVKKENLVRPMITGNKILPAGSAFPTLHVRGAWLALLILAVVTLLVWVPVKSA